MTSALVLGGGGVTGVAWELGVLAGLHDEGVEVRGADLVIGTSAGSTVGAQLTSGTSLDDLVAAQLVPAAQTKEIAVDLDFDRLAEIFVVLYDRSIEPLERRRRVGAMALAAPTIDEATRREVIAARLPSSAWPDPQRLVIVAVDATSGEWLAIDRDAGIDLVDAVTASSAVPGVWPPVTVGDRRFVDGGMRSSTNADLAADADTVLVLTPLGDTMSIQLPEELEVLAARGCTADVIAADEEALAGMGTNPLDPELRAAAVAEGRRQGRAAAGRIRTNW